jgi:hypothetical protein
MSTERLADKYGHIDESCFYDCGVCGSRVPHGGVNVEGLMADCDQELADLRAAKEKAERELAEAKASFSESLKREMRQWLDSPAFKTFVDLKYGIVGDVLASLQDGEISRGRAAECLAEIAHGAAEVRIPKSQGFFGEDEFPIERVKQAESECDTLKRDLADALAQRETLRDRLYTLPEIFSQNYYARADHCYSGAEIKVWLTDYVRAALRDLDAPASGQEKGE